jgi:hypothetical protein
MFILFVFTSFNYKKYEKIRSLLQISYWIRKEFVILVKVMTFVLLNSKKNQMHIDSSQENKISRQFLNLAMGFHLYYVVGVTWLGKRCQF